MDWTSLLLFTLVILLIVAANVGERFSRAWRFTAYVGAVVLGLGAVVLGLAYLLAGAIMRAAPQAMPDGARAMLVETGGPLVALWLIVGGLVSWLVLLPAVRRALARALPIRPESTVNALALSLLALLWAQSLSLSGLGPQIVVSLSGQLTVTQVLASEVPLAIMGITGVGYLIRRSSPMTWRRLGVGGLTRRQGLVTLVVLLGLLTYQFLVSAVARAIAPQAFEELDRASSQLYAGLQAPLAALIVSLASGTAEELLFRGALQPRFGLALTALTFAVVHAQYGLVFALVSIGVVGLALGIVRQRINTTAAILVHVFYNLTLFLLSRL
ncbi:MAG: lysostaphin resistance A-like protein [Anaerolineae bacterium]